ncbi:hypothetical protein ACI8AG_10655 [Blastococcus sp. SYSU DS0552]
MRVPRRTLEGIADQVVSSASNFVFVVLVARSASAADFGAFSVGYAGIVLLLAFGRAALGTPLLIGAADDGRRGRLGDALVLGCGLGLIGGLLVAASVLVAGSAPAIAVVLGVGAPVAVLQDVCRHGAIAAGRPRVALGIDTLWLLAVGAALLADVQEVHRTDVLSAVSVWVIGGVAGALVAVAWLKPTVVPAGVANRLRGSLRLRSDLTIAVVLPQVAMLVVLAVVAVGLSSPDVAALRGAGTLMGPVNLLFAAMTFAVLPEIARMGRSVPVLRIAGCMYAGLALVVLTWATILLLLPDGAGRALLGESWTGARDVLPFISAEALFGAASIAAGTVLQARGAARLHARARTLYAAGVLCLGVPLAFVVSDVRFMAAAFVGCAAAAAALSWTFLVLGRHATPDSEPAPEAVAASAAVLAPPGSTTGTSTAEGR